MKIKLGIIGAMSIEVASLKSILKPLNGQNSIKEQIFGETKFYEGLLEGLHVVIVQSGIGKVNAALCAQRLISDFSVSHIINTGIAGAMAKGLKVLDFVVSKDAVYHDMDATGFGYKITEIPQMKCSAFKGDDYLLNLISDAFNDLTDKENKLIIGRVATGDQFISDKTKKQKIKEDCDPACVEMEGAAIAHTAYLNNIPFAIIRCMSDMADDAGEETYSFNEEKAADLSAKLLINTIRKLNESNN